ncbi:MAG: tetratricopeptide repeat protein, partial [bacterium]
MKKISAGYLAGLLLALTAFYLTVPVVVRSEVDFDANYWYDKGYEETNLDLKIKYYNKSLELKADNPDIYNNLGVIYKKKGLYKKAVEYFQKALLIVHYKTPEYAYINLALVYRLQKKYPEAISTYKKAIQLNPAFPQSYNGLGMTYKDMGDFDNALKQFKLALEVNPGFVAADLNIKNLWKVSAGDSS